MNFPPRTPELVFCISLLLLVFVNQASATGITGTRSYSSILTATDFLDGESIQYRPENAIPPFDPALGTLTDVEIRIFGGITYTGFAGGSWVNDPMGTPQFIPYTLQTEYQLDIDGLFGDYFSLATPLIIEKNFQSPGLPDFPIIGSSSFGFTFDYDELLNQVFWGPEDTSCSGCDGYTMPIQMDGELDGFIGDGLLVDQMDFNYRLSFVSLGGVPRSITSLTATSDIVIQYTYEFTEPDVPPVPIPAAAWLFATGIIGLIGFVRRQKAD